MKTKIYAEIIEPKALEQFESAMEMPWVVQGALMPDVHVGYSLPIGAVVATEDMVVPAWVGYDIGCGMCALQTSIRPEDIILNAPTIFNAIYKAIPIGLGGVNPKAEEWKAHLDRTPMMDEFLGRKKQLGTLGSGNHFIEIGADENNKVWIVIHSGSRGLGHATATHYMKVASKSSKAREGHFALDVKSEEGKNYIKDLNFALAYALENRERMILEVCDVLSLYGRVEPTSSLINRNHNHAERKNGLWIHRKGATHAEEGMWGVIPGNMRDGSFIVVGKGNPDSLYSSSHGAGRVLGRRKAKDTLSLDEFTRSMTGITAKVGLGTIDESPMAYKNIFDVMELQSDLVEVKNHIKPIINIKA